MLSRSRSGLLILAFVSALFATHSSLFAAAGDCIAIEFTEARLPQCETMKRATDQAILEGWVVRRMDPKQEPHVALRYQIQSVPTTVLVRNGRELDRIVGPISYDELRTRMTEASSVDSLKRDDSIGIAERPLVRGQSPLAMVPSLANSAIRQNNGFDRQPIANTTSPSSPATPARTSNIKQSDPREATVRIRVEEANQEGVGTGTIIDSFNGEALVLTCGHLFRDSQGQAKIVVETFIGGQTQSYPATLIDFQAKETDIGLISFRPNSPISVATLIPINRKLSEGQPVFSWGCDRGADPSRRDSRITKLNRYLGAPNVEVDGLPVEGRSGGGLFDDRGELIGVCYAADPSLKEGLYNSAEVVYQQLAKLGLQRLFNERIDEPVRPAENTLVGAPTRAPASFATPEITVVLRDRNGKQEQFQIAQPTPQLLQTLRDNAVKR